MTQHVREQQTWLMTGSLVVLATVTIAFTLHYMQNVLVPFILAIFVGSIVSPVLDMLELRWKFSHTASVVIALLLVLLASVIFAMVLMWAVQTVVNNSDEYATRFEQIGDSILLKVESLVPERKSEEIESEAGPEQAPQESEPALQDEKLDDDSSDATRGIGGDQREINRESIADETADAAVAPDIIEDSRPAEGTESSSANSGAPASGLQPLPPLEVPHRTMRDFLRSLAPRFATAAGASMLNILSGVALTTIFVMFILSGRDPNVIRRGVYAEIDTKIRNYIATKVALSLATGFFVWLILYLLNMPMALVFGTLAFLLNFIPSVGSIVATVVPLPFALAEVPGLFQSQPRVSLTEILWVIAVVLLPGAVQMTIGNILEPKVMGEGLKLHPITILLALAVWGLLWGPIGMLLATPMTAIIRIVLMRFEITQPAGRVLAGELPDLDAKETA